MLAFSYMIKLPKYSEVFYHMQSEETNCYSDITWFYVFAEAYSDAFLALSAVNCFRKKLHRICLAELCKSDNLMTRILELLLCS